MELSFTIKPDDDFIWNKDQLLDFLISNQSRSIRIMTNSEGCCAETVGLYRYLDKFQFQRVVIETSNIFEKHPKYEIKVFLPWKYLTLRFTIDNQYHHWNKRFVFGTLYGRPLWHRLGIAAHLLNHHRGISKVGLVADPRNLDNRELFEVGRLWQYNPQSFCDFAKIQHLLPLVHSEIETYDLSTMTQYNSIYQSLQTYPDFLIDVVAETYTSGRCFFITEKTVRPILLKKPFLVYGPKDYLNYLRQMGFRTFGDFWDETYDGYCGSDRYAKLLTTIDTLADMSLSDLETMYWDMQYTLDHNYDLLMSKKFQKTITPL